MVTPDKDLSNIIDGRNPFFDTIRYISFVLKNLSGCFHPDFANILRNFCFLYFSLFLLIFLFFIFYLTRSSALIDVPATVALMLEMLPILKECSNNNLENGCVLINCAERP